MALKTVLSRGNLQWHSKTWPLFCKSGWFLNELADRCPKRIEHYTLNKYPGVIVGALRNVNEKYKAISRTFLGQLLLSNWKSWCMFLASSDGVYRRFQIKDSHSVFFFFFDSMYLSSSLSPDLSLYILLWTTMLLVIACLSKANYVLSIKIFVSVLVLGLTDVFLHVNPEVSVYVSTGRKIPKSNLKEACQTCL